VISSVEGALSEVLADSVVLTSGGLGFRVFVPVTVLSRLPRRGETVRLHTHLHVKEDALTLYGFVNAAERDMFTTLLSVSGVGPRAALNVLSVVGPEELQRTVAFEDVDSLTRIPGIGPKTARRLLMELKDRLGGEPRRRGPRGGERRAVVPRDAAAEALEALVALGCGRSEAGEAVHAAIQARLEEAEGPPDPETIIRDALRALGADR